MLNEDPALRMSAFLLEYPFSERLYPRTLAVLDHLRSIDTTAILADGDIMFQPRKIRYLRAMAPPYCAWLRQRPETAP